MTTTIRITYADASDSNPPPSAINARIASVASVIASRLPRHGEERSDVATPLILSLSKDANHPGPAAAKTPQSSPGSFDYRQCHCERSVAIPLILNLSKDANEIATSLRSSQ